jgi:hypothetical protein
MSLSGREQDPKRLMEEVPQEPITADPYEDDQDEDLPDEDEERGGEAGRVGEAEWDHRTKERPWP